MGKEPVEANDSPGFISNRILCPMINEAIFALQENVGTAEAIDTVMKLGMNHPMGPLALADLIGLDVVLFVMEVLQRDLGEDKYRPAPLLRRMVDAGHLGRKDGPGFLLLLADRARPQPRQDQGQCPPCRKIMRRELDAHDPLARSAADSSSRIRISSTWMATRWAACPSASQSGSN